MTPNTLYCNRFVQKVYTLDPTTDAIPWNSRGYSRKRKPLTGQYEEEAKRLQLMVESATMSDEASGKNTKDLTCGKCV